MKGDTHTPLIDTCRGRCSREECVGNDGIQVRCISLLPLIDQLSAMNVPVYRSSFAMLWINEVNYGLYNIVEDIGKDFLDSRYGESDGNLYRACAFHAPLKYHNDDPSYVDVLFLFVFFCLHQLFLHQVLREYWLPIYR